MNPTVSADLLAAEQRRDPVGFAAEYEAAFVGSGGAYLDFDMFEVVRRPEALPREGTGWIAGLDPATSSDPFGVALVGRSVDNPQRLVIGPVLGLRATSASPFTELVGHVVDVCKTYRASAITDQYLAHAITEHLRAAGIAVTTNTMSAQSKTLAYGELRTRLYDGTVELRDDAELVAELRRLRTQHSAGRASVVSPRVGGSHGDRAQALALAVAQHSMYGGGGGHDRLHSGRGGTLLADLMGREL